MAVPEWLMKLLPTLIPSAIAGVGAGLGAGVQGEVTGYSRAGAPRASDLRGTVLGDTRAAIEHPLAIAMGRTETPISLGTQSIVQPLAGLSGVDPAIFDPRQITRQGVEAGNRGPFSQLYRGDGLGTVPQPSPPYPDTSQLMATLALLGVQRDTSGNLFTGATPGGWDNTGGGNNDPYLFDDPEVYDRERIYPARTPGSPEDYDLPMNPDWVTEPGGGYDEGSLGEPGGEGSETEGPGGPGSIFAFTGARPLPQSGVRRKSLNPPFDLAKLAPSAALNEAFRRRKDSVS